MEMSGPFILPEVTSVAIAQEAGWAPEPVWTFRRSGKACKKRRYAANTSKYLPTFRKRVLPSSSVSSSPRKLRNNSSIVMVSCHRRIQPSSASLCEQLVSQDHKPQQSAPTSCQSCASQHNLAPNPKAFDDLNTSSYKNLTHEARRQDNKEEEQK